MPSGESPAAVDAEVIDRYGVEVSKCSRSRRKHVGGTSLQYLRFDRLILVLTTHGWDRFFDDEEASIRDVRCIPIKCFGYAISHRRGRVHVRIEREEFKRLKAHFLELATHWRAESIASAFAKLPFESYAPIRRQLLIVWRGVNRARKSAGFEPVPIECIRLRRRVVRPFENAERGSIHPAEELY